MKFSHFFIFFVMPLLLMGCAATRPITDVALAGGGAALANTLSKGDPAITAAGAAGGVLFGEGLNYVSTKQTEKASLEGYEKGRSDTAKQQYWFLVNQEKDRDQQQESIRYYEIPIPEQKIDGVILNPTTKYLRIEE